MTNAIENTMIQQSKPSSSGGTIKFTPTGLIHISGKRYSGMSAEAAAKASAKPAAK